MVRVAAHVPVLSPVFLAYSPDGREIAFAAHDGGTTRLLRHRLGATEPPRVILDAVPSPYGCMLEWSPTGEWIAHDRPDGLWLVSPDGATQRKLTADRAIAVALAYAVDLMTSMRTPFRLTLSGLVARQSPLVHIDVSAPKQVYWLNHYPKVSHTIYLEDFDATIPVSGGAAVVIREMDGNDRQIDNNEPGRPDRMQIIKGVHEKPLDGQMLRLDVVSVTIRR